MKKGERRIAKFMPRFDGPYTITGVHPATSNYTIEMPNSPDTFPTYHASDLKLYHANDDVLFPLRAYARPPPVLGADGLEEYFIEKIVDARRRGRGWQFLVRWLGYGEEEDRWVSGLTLNDCEALDCWYDEGGDGPDREEQGVGEDSAGRRR